MKRIISDIQMWNQTETGLELFLTRLKSDVTRCLPGTFEFVSWDKVLKQGEEIVPTAWTFWKKCLPSGEVY